MKNCPNIKHPDWMALRDKGISYVNAYRLFVNNGNTIPRAISAFKTVNDIILYLSSNPRLSKYSDKFYVKHGGTEYLYKINLNAISEEIERINTMYNGQLLVLDRHALESSKTGRKQAYYVDINEVVLKDFYKGFKTMDKEANITINEDGDIIPFEDSTYQARGNYSDDLDVIKDFKKKTQFLLQFFPDYRVVEDWEMPIPGEIFKDSKTIKLNPKLLTKDTVGHEFGHILIDSIGGMQNEDVQKARNLLKGSRIEFKVLNDYKDLVGKDDTRLDKEIVAAAIGVDFAELFSDSYERGNWIRIFSNLKVLFRSLLGIEENAVRLLSRRLVNGSWTETNKTGDELLIEEYNKTVNAEKVSKVEKLKDEALNTLYRKKKLSERHKKDSKTAAIAKLITDIERLDKDSVESLRLFQNFAYTETQTIFLEYLEAVRKEAQGEEGFTIRKLNKWKDYIVGFNSIELYIKMYKEAAFDKENPERADKIKNALDLQKLQDIVDRSNSIKDAYTEHGIKLVAKFLHKYSNHIKVQFKENYERDYNKLPQEEKDKYSLEEYLNKKLSTNEDIISKLTEDSIKNELIKASKDVNQITRWLDNLLDSTDPVVSSMVSAFADTTRTSRLERHSLADEMIDIVRQLEQQHRDKVGLLKSSKDLYDYMLETDNKGNYTGNISYMYLNTFKKDYYTQRSILINQGWYPDPFERKIQHWLNENAPMSVKDKSYFIKAGKEYLDTLVKSNTITLEQKKELEIYIDSPIKEDIYTLVSDDVANSFIKWLDKNSWKYRTPIDKYKSESWKKLVEIASPNSNIDKLSTYEQFQLVTNNNIKDPRLTFYNFIQDKIAEIQDSLPYIHRIDNHLPGVTKKTNEIIREKGISFDVIKQYLKESVDILSDETGRGEEVTELTTSEGKPLMFVPVYYTKKLDIKDQSFDIADIYLKYFSSAIDFKNKSTILPEMEMARFLVNNRQVTRRDEKGRSIVEKIRSKELTSSGISSLIAGQLNDWFEAVVYDVKEKKEGKLFGKVDVAKTLNTLNKYTAFNMLGVNFIQGTANVLLGSTMQWVEAFGGENYTPKDYLKAKKVYSKQLANTINDIGSRKQTGLISLLNMEFDTLNDYGVENIRRDSKFGKLMTSNTVMFTSSAGEHMMQSKAMLAMLNHTQAKDSKGNVLGSMLDMAKVKDGKLIFEDNKGIPVANFGTEERNVFEGKMKRMLSSMHGEYSDLGRVAIQRYALGRMGYMFRKFIVVGVKRRWGKKRINNISNDYTEGYYRTTVSFLGSLVKDLRKLQLSIMSEDWSSLTIREKANIRKALSEIGFLLSAMLLLAVFVKPEDDDDEKDSWLSSFLSYQAYRFKTELAFFFNPMEAMKILRSPAASMSMIENSIKFIGQILPPDFEGFERYERGSWKGDFKINKTMIDFIPAYKQIYRLKNVSDQIGWLR